MAAGDARLLFGTTITFATSGFESDMKFEGFGFSGIQREIVEAPHAGLVAPAAGTIGNVPKVLTKIVNAGSLNLSIFFDPDVEPPIHADFEQITIQWPATPSQVSGATWVFSGAIKSFVPQGEVSGKMMASVEIEIDGGIAITAGVAA